MGRLGKGFVTLVSGGVAASGAWAQAVEEIVVTARKQTETLIAAPVAVTAFTAEDLAQRGISDLRSLSDFVPSFRAGKQSTNRNDRGNQVFVVRGMFPGSDLPGRQAATVFIDGVPVGNGNIAGLTDVERVEVVPGPQSAYYGRATFSGAVNFITRAPGFDGVRAMVDGSYASYDTRDVKASVEAPLVDEKLSARISGRHYGTDGQYRNFAYPGRLGAQTTNSLALSLFAQPTDSVRLRGYATGWWDRDGPPAAGQLYAADYNCRTPTSTGALNYICGEIDELPKDRMTQQILIPANIIQILQDNATINGANFQDDFGIKRNAMDALLSAEVDLSGGYLLSLNGSYHKDRWGFITDTSFRDGRATPNPNFGRIANVLPYFSRTVAGQSYYRNSSAELRLTSPQENRLTWMIGANYYRFREDRVTVAFANTGFSFSVRPTLDGSNTYGVFGSGSYDIGGGFSASVEGRYQWDKVIQQVPFSNLNSAATFKSFSPRVILRYQPSDEQTIYVSYARGTRPGQFNGSLYQLPPNALSQVLAQVAAPLAVPEEKVQMGELGFKGYALDRRLRILAALYYGHWSNRHITQTVGYFNPGFTTTTFLMPNGKVKLYGLELEAEVRLTDELTLEGMFNYAESDIRLTDDTPSRQLLGNPNPVGNRLPRYPAYNASLSASYAREVADNTLGFVRVDAIYTGKQYDSEANLAWTSAGTRVNLRLGIEREPYRLEVFGENVFNDETPLNITRSTDTYTGVNTIALSPAPRPIVGVRVVYRN